MLEHKVQYLNFCCAVGRCLSTVHCSKSADNVFSALQSILTSCGRFQRRNPQSVSTVSQPCFVQNIISIQKSKIQNQEFVLFENLRSFQKSGNFATSCSPVARFVSQIWIQKSTNLRAKNPFLLKMTRCTTRQFAGAL